MTRKYWIGLALALLLSACANYTLVSPGDHSIKQMTVTAETSWNQPPGGMGTTIWTSNRSEERR
ncbi:MAG: hypothetical protein AB7E69_03915, partial [Sphingomonadales bacterium]